MRIGVALGHSSWILCVACSSAGKDAVDASPDAIVAEATTDQGESDGRPYLLERVDDVAVVQLYADGFDQLPLEQKVLAWHLYQAAIAGRDIYLQQKCGDGLAIRDLFEEILTHADHVEESTLVHLRRYAKLFWVNNSPYSYVTSRKHVLGCTPEELLAAAEAAEADGADFPDFAGPTAKHLVAWLTPMLFDPEHRPVLTAKSPEPGTDLIAASSVTFYGDGVTVAGLERFRERYRLNSNVVATERGELAELVWRAGHDDEGVPAGLYAREIGQIIQHLEAAAEVAPEPTAAALEALVRFYRTGREEDRFAYDIAWVADDDPGIDTINGFVEVYDDPRGLKGSWEALVFYENARKTREVARLAQAAQWFEDRMPFDEDFRKPQVQGITARAIDVIIETGASGPVTPVGINLPNDSVVREHHGSKSVSLSNVITALAAATPDTALDEFCFDQAERERARKWQRKTSELLANLHEVIGHASGRQDPDTAPGDPAVQLQEYYSTIEEARSDLVALYFIGSPYMREMGFLDAPADAALAAYEHYVRNAGLLQLRRMKGADQLEQDHMRNRQMIVRWIEANSRCIEEQARDGKRFLSVVDAEEFRDAAGRLLALVQRIKSTGDYDGAEALVRTFGVHFDADLRDEVVERYESLGVAAYTGFVMPRLRAVRNARDEIVDVTVSYPLSLEQQMLEWSGRVQPPVVGQP